MTLQELEKYEKEYITPDMVAAILDANPQSVRDTANLCPERLGFPVIRVGKHYRFPRLAFINFMKYGKQPVLLVNDSEVTLTETAYINTPVITRANAVK